MAGMMTGGLSAPVPATPEVQEIATKMKGQLEEQTNARYSMFQALLYRSQVVAGTNYFIKVQHGDAERDYVHLRVFQALPVNGGELELSSYQLGKTRDDPITYF